MALLVRKRRADGSLGEFVKVFDGETQEEVLERIKEDNQELAKMVEANLVATRKLIRVDDLTDEELGQMVDLYDEYKLDYAYEKDDIFKYKGKLYKVLKGLTSQEGWKPDETPSEYLPLQPEGVIPEWVAPTGAHDAYSIGDKVIFEGDVYESTIDSNTWSPTDYAAGWEKVE